jgi:hypothetical protein
MFLRDRTAFDAYVEYRSGRKRGFLGIETKYTEPFSFSQKVHGDDARKAPAYVKYTKPSFGWRADCYDIVKASATNQLWRNAMLGLALRDDKKAGFDEGYDVVLACAGDPGAQKALTGITAQRSDDFVRALTFEGVVDEAAEYESTEYSALELRQRYLDLQPVLAAKA